MTEATAAATLRISNQTNRKLANRGKKYRPGANLFGLPDETEISGPFREGPITNRIGPVSDVRPWPEFGSFAVNPSRTAYYRLKRDAAPGVERMTWDGQGEGLEARLRHLESRIHLGSDRAHPSLRADIPKSDGWQRLLGNL